VQKPKIAIIGKGNVGKALAFSLCKANYEVIIGARSNSDTDQMLKIGSMDLDYNANIAIHSIPMAISESDVIVIATPPLGAINILQAIKSTKSQNKIYIDATNSISSQVDQSPTVLHYLKENGINKVVKCFNSTGYENMMNPSINGLRLDMPIAGSDVESLKMAKILAEDIGFDVWIFGKDDKVELLEQFALAWINLAIIQGYGREIGIKILKREN